MVETMIEDMINAQDNPTIATYAKVGEVDVRVTASAGNEKDAHKLVKPVVKEIKKRFGAHIFTTDEAIIAEGKSYLLIIMWTFLLFLLWRPVR